MRFVLAISALVLSGIMLVLDVFAGAHINSAGVAWGLAAAICAACYFMMSEKVSGSSGAIGDEHPDAPLHPITLATAGLFVGAAAVSLIGFFAG